LLTSDIWTDGDGHSYISLTIHFVTDGFELRSWTLEVHELPGIHDGAAIAASLNEMSAKWGLSKEYCAKLVRDGGMNMVSGAGIAGFSSMSCVAHSLYLVVAGAMVGIDSAACSMVHEYKVLHYSILHLLGK
jgi:hypothetical protein